MAETEGGIMLPFLNMLIDSLKTVGIPASLDARDVNPPAAWVGGRRADSFYLGGGISSMTAEILLISPAVGGASDVKTLDYMLKRAMDALDVHAIGLDSVEFDATATLPGGGPLPAYRLICNL